MLETRSRKARHTQQEMTRWTSVRLAKARTNKAKESTAKAKAKGNRDSKDNKDKCKDKDKDKNKDSIDSWNCGKRGHYSKDCWSKKDTNRGGSKGKHKTKNATDARNLDSAKPANTEPEVEFGGFDLSYLDADAVEVRESEWIMIGVDTGAGKTASPQSVTHCMWCCRIGSQLSELWNPQGFCCCGVQPRLAVSPFALSLLNYFGISPRGMQVCCASNHRISVHSTLLSFTVNLMMGGHWATWQAAWTWFTSSIQPWHAADQRIGAECSPLVLVRAVVVNASTSFLDSCHHPGQLLLKGYVTHLLRN